MKHKDGACLISSGEFSVVHERRGAGCPLSLTYIKMEGESAADRRINEFVARLIYEGERFTERVHETSGEGALVSAVVKGTRESKELHLTLSLTARRGAHFISRADFDFCLSLANGRLTRFKQKSPSVRGKK